MYMNCYWKLVIASDFVNCGTNGYFARILVDSPVTRHSQSITCKVLLEPRYSNYENKLTNISKTFIQNFVDLPAEHPEDNEIIIPL